MTKHISRLRRALAPCLFGAALLTLSACSTFSADGGFTPVAQTARERIGKDVQWRRGDAGKAALDERIASLLAQPLSVDDAVQIALWNNAGLQAAFFELGIAEADVVQAGRMPNPGLSFSRKRAGDELVFDRGIEFNLGRLLTMPLDLKIARAGVEQSRRRATNDMLALAFETRKAYLTAVAANQTVAYMLQVKEAAEAAAELARRMEQAGNFTKLQHAREQGFYADAGLTLLRAEQAQVRARERLIRLLGLAERHAALTLQERLPDLPADLPAQSDLEQRAMRERLDVQAAVIGTQQLADRLGLSRTTQLINVLELGAVNTTTSGQATERGFAVRLELPLFDWGDARVARAEAQYRQALARTAQTALEARSEVREAYALYRSHYEIARRYRDEIVPLKKRISDENQLRYNGMLIGVFDLLADARSQIAGVNGAIEAQRDFWIAQADMDMSLTGKPAMATDAAGNLNPRE